MLLPLTSQSTGRRRPWLPQRTKLRTSTGTTLMVDGGATVYLPSTSFAGGGRGAV